jgi:cleavage and polyadenylation specificity factor subunit 2
MFTFSPLEGGFSSLLELDGGVKVLVDVGWNDKFDATALQHLEK